MLGGASTTCGSGGPPRPIDTTTTSRSRASSRATWPVTAVFPTRLPVPITARDGSGNDSYSGGSKRKSAPTYGNPSASARLAHSIRARGPSTGSSERSNTTSASTASSASTIGTPYSSPPTSFSVPPTTSAATTSYGSAASASRTTGA